MAKQTQPNLFGLYSMWCTRWFLPLLLLPLPTAPPYFLLLFLLSLTMHAKPCFYCIILLTTLFVSSCYWQPFPLDTPLATPWSANITTFGEALNASIPQHITQPLPLVLRAPDRCWCDFAGGNFFEPFDITQWERASVLRAKEDMERQHLLSELKSIQKVIAKEPIRETGSRQPKMPKTLAPAPSATPSVSARIQSRYYRAINSLFGVNIGRSVKTLADSSPSEHSKQSSLQVASKQYDLRQFGIDIIIDFGWKRNSERTANLL